MARTTTPTFANVEELLQRLGNIPPARVSLCVPPGTATVRDLLAAMKREGRLYELVDGTLVEKPMGLSESYLALEIGSEIRAFVRKHDLGIAIGADGTFRLLKGLVRLPDVAFVCWDKLPDRLLPTKAVPELAPDLAVEVLSKGNTAEEIERKLGEYFLAGVRLVWIVDPKRRCVAVHTSADSPSATLTEKDTLDGADVLPGFSLPLKELFARLPETQSSPRRKKKS